MRTVRKHQLSERIGVIRELVRDAICTTNPFQLLDLVSRIELETAQFRSVEGISEMVRFRLTVGGHELSVIGGNIHATNWDSWDVVLWNGGDVEELDSADGLGWVGNSSCLSAPQMVALLKNIGTRK